MRARGSASTYALIPFELLVTFHYTIPKNIKNDGQNNLHNSFVLFVNIGLIFVQK
jgi:hypothetical protein